MTFLPLIISSKIFGGQEPRLVAIPAGCKCLEKCALAVPKAHVSRFVDMRYATSAFSKFLPFLYNSLLFIWTLTILSGDHSTRVPAVEESRSVAAAWLRSMAHVSSGGTELEGSLHDSTLHRQSHHTGPR